MGMVILFEGMDGAGKSTTVKLLAEELDKLGKTVQVQAFPSRNGPIGQFIRNAIFSGEVTVDPRAMLPLMVADAIDLDRKILEWKEKFDYVLLDRHSIISAWAYQLGPWDPTGVGMFASPAHFLCLPDAIFVMDVPEDVAMKRLESRTEKKNPLYERGEDYARELRSRYLATIALFSDQVPITSVDSQHPPEVLVSLLSQAVMSLEEKKAA